MKHEDVFFKHMRDEIYFLLKEAGSLSSDEFMNNEVLKKASARSLEIIGEAAKNISSESKNKYKDIEWKKLAGLRDKLIHYYFGVDWDIVWDIIKNRLPELKVQVEKILSEMEKK